MGQDTGPAFVVQNLFLLLFLGGHVVGVRIQIHGHHLDGNVNLIGTRGVYRKHEVVEVPPVGLDVGLGSAPCLLGLVVGEPLGRCAMSWADYYAWCGSGGHYCVSGGCRSRGGVRNGQGIVWRVSVVLGMGTVVDEVGGPVSVSCLPLSRLWPLPPLVSSAVVVNARASSFLMKAFLGML